MYLNYQNGGKAVLDTNSHNGYAIQFKQVTAKQSKLLNLVKLCFLPVYRQLCDACWVHGDTMWLHELISDNYIPAFLFTTALGIRKLQMLD